MPVYGFLANFGARRFPKGNEGKTQGGLPLGNPVCLWQTELFKLNLKSSPSSSGYNRRRRLATRSSGKQQAERTAVRTAPIVCPEESPLARPQAHSFCRRGLTRRLRRGRWGCRPDGGSYFLSARKKVPKKASGTATPEAARPASRRGLRSAGAPSGLSSTSVRCAHPPEKGFYCPFCRRGSQRRAQFSWTDNSYAYALSCARLFPPSKWAGLFPFAAYRRSAPPPLGWGRN